MQIKVSLIELSFCDVFESILESNILSTLTSLNLKNGKGLLVIFLPPQLCFGLAAIAVFIQFSQLIRD